VEEVEHRFDRLLPLRTHGQVRQFERCPLAGAFEYDRVVAGVAEEQRCGQLLLEWMMKLAMHNTGTRTAYATFKHYQKYETASISARLTQEVLLMAGAEDHYIPVHQLPDQIVTLTHVRLLTARLFTRAEQAQNHYQIGNYGLEFRTIIDWMTGLGPIEKLTGG
jgi:hypothetical protein